MKRLLPTLILVIICAAGFWYASSQNFFKEEEQQEAMLVDYKVEDVASYTIKTPDHEISLEQKDGVWTMQKPSPFPPMNDFTAGNWPGIMLGIKRGTTVTEEAANLADFGLDNPNSSFFVTLKDGTEHKLLIGDPLPIPDYTYAKFEESPEIFQIQTTDINALSYDPLKFMDDHPFKMNFNQVQSMSVEWKGAGWTITRNEADKGKNSYESGWKIDGKDADGATGSGFLDAAVYLSTDQVGKQVREIPGLDQPELSVEVREQNEQGSEKVSRWVGKQDGELVWVAAEGGEWAYALPLAKIEALGAKKTNWESEQAAQPAEQPATEGQTGAEQPPQSSSQ